jgi:hypothetical protein
MSAILLERIRQYAARTGRVLDEELGTGVQGTVHTIRRRGEIFAAAVKAHSNDLNYARERDVYLQLKEFNTTQICGCDVPWLWNHDDELLILEMTIVQRPFILDFGGAYLMYPPDFSDDILADEDRKRRELYGDDYPRVMTILRALEQLDIYMIDVHPGNISFRVQ